MGSKQANELEKWEIEDFTAEKAIYLLTSVGFISGPRIMYAIAYLIQQQERDYRAVLSARAETIEDMERRIAERDKQIERQERMIKNAIDVIQEDSGDCPLNAGCCCIEDENCHGPCPLDGSDEQAEKCWRRWLEQGAQ